MARKILIVLLIITIAAVGIGYYFYNKGPVDVQNSSTISTNAGALYDAYMNDSSAAQKMYTNKIITVSGIVKDISVNQQQNKIVILKTNAADAYINCTFEENVTTIKMNESVLIIGICSGIGEGDVDLGIKGDVYLTRCYLVK